MISDILFDAAEDIKQYQIDCPGAYDPIRAKIDEVVVAMEELRITLDTPPRHDSPRTSIQHSISRSK